MAYFKILQSKKGFTPIWLAIVTFLSLPLLSIAIVKFQARGEIYTVQNAPNQEVALVLGAAVYGTRLSDILEDRVDTAIELYGENKVELIVMSGAEHEAYAMKLYAVEHGIPSEKVIEDPNGLNTFSSLQNLEGSQKKFAIVSQEYHLPRALYVAKKLDLDAVGVESNKSEYIKIGEFKRREWVATSWIVFYLWFLR